LTPIISGEQFTSSEAVGTPLNITVNTSIGGIGDKGKEAAEEASAVNASEATTNKAAIAILEEEFDKVISGLTLQDDPFDKEIDRPSKLLKAYLFKNEAQFLRVMELHDGVSHSTTTGIDSMELTKTGDGT
jgi:hypothetical protein